MMSCQPLKTAVCLVALCSALVGPTASLCAAEPPANEADGAWMLILTGAARDPGPLRVHLRTRQGKVTQAWATRGQSNLAYDVDASALAVSASGLSGRAIVNLGEVRHRYRLAVTRDGAELGGHFKGEYGLTEVDRLGGEVAGGIAPRMDAPGPVRFDLCLRRGLPGMTGAISEVRLVFTWRDGQAREAKVESTTGRKPTPHWSGTVKSIRLRYDGRRLAGKLVIHVDRGSFLWKGTGDYELALDGEQSGNFVYGPVQTQKHGAEVCRGAINGQAMPAPERKTEPGGPRAVSLVLDEAVDGRESLALYLEHREGRFSGVAVATHSPGGGVTHAVDASKLELKGDTLSGTVTVQIEPGAWGQGTHRPAAARFDLDATLTNGEWQGRYTGRYEQPAVEGRITGRWQSWEAVAAGEALRPGHDYPCWRGPFSNGTSPPAGHELVDSLADMRLVWKSEEPLPMSWIWGADRIGGIVGGFCSPIIADGRIFMFYYEPSGEFLVTRRADTRGRDRKRWERKYRVDADDVFVCIDAATGRTIWRRAFAQKGINYNGVGGHGAFMVPCVAEERVYGIGSAGRVYCVSARSGKVVWETTLGPAAERVEAIRQRCREQLVMPKMKRDFCSAPTLVDGMLICNDNAGGLIGLDGDTGQKQWGPIPDCTTQTSSPLRWRHQGRNYVIVAADSARCIEPRSGKVIWEAPGASNAGAVALTDRYMVCAAAKPPSGKGEQDDENRRRKSGLAAYRIDRSGAEQIWHLPGYNNHVTSPVIYKGHVYAFAGRQTICVNLETGKIVGEVDFPGTRTCSSLVAADGRVLRENLYRQIHFYDADPTRFRRLGPVWHPTGHAENTTSTIVDGRLFMRGREALYCYDMREPR